jgi:hypothetical protein
MNEVKVSGEFTIDEHVDRIKKCLERTRDSIFETVISIKECREQLGEDVFQKDVSKRLGMSPSTLNRWISIGNSQFILDHQRELPHTFSSLYNITQLEKKYLEHYPRDGVHRLEKLIEKGEISLTSQQSDIKEILIDIEQRIKSKKKKKREQDILDFDGSVSEPSVKTETLTNLLSINSKFRTFVIKLPKELISRWGNEGLFEFEISEEFPIHELRYPSVSEPDICLMIVPINKVNVGLKVLSSFGFNYRDTFIPNHDQNGLKLMKDELVILRGERGIGSEKPLDPIPSSSINDVLEFIEGISGTPRLLVFEETDRDGWTSVIEK